MTVEPPHTLPVPPDDRLSLVEDQRGCEIRIRPLGIYRGSFGLWIFALLLVLLPGLMVLRVLTTHGQYDQRFAILMGTLIALGCALSVIANELGKLRYRIAITREHFALEKRGLLYRSYRQVERQAIATVETGEGPFTMMNRPVEQLVVTVREQPPMKLLLGRAPDELAWTQDAIRYALQRADTAPATST